MSHPIRRNIRTISQLEEAAHSSCSPVQRLSDSITRFAGTLGFLIVQVIVIGIWIILHLREDPLVPFDPYPFHLLSLFVGVQALALAIFVLMNQKRMTHIADQRAHIDLQVNLLAEQEMTYALHTLKRIAKRLRVEMKEESEEIEKLTEKTDVKELVDELDRNTSC